MLRTGKHGPMVLFCQMGCQLSDPSQMKLASFDHLEDQRICPGRAGRSNPFGTMASDMWKNSKHQATL
jgi:hypothetical protein